MGLNVITCHLSAGDSPTAVLAGCSADTDGVHPARGPGHGDQVRHRRPGLVLWLEEHEHRSPHEIANRPGVALRAAFPGGTADMRQVQAAADWGDPDAQRAINVYIHRLASGIASMSRQPGVWTCSRSTAAWASAPS
jgi:acetate kinase